ncbi:MAG: cobyrinate a,c-diamide synthase [Rhodocyclaceae bacterium]|nr:cobyrinate a,c-diamide synthase [Rhodocyclaceae bacterium]
MSIDRALILHRFLVSAAHKSSGKTTICIGLVAALKARGRVVQPFKKGPDYIDPLWLTQAAARPCRNLDFHLSSHEEIIAQFSRHGGDADVCIVEGNKGLYDGLALDGTNSNAALAKLLDLPVILVLDARGMTRGIAPLVLGYQAFDRDIRIAGVILNRLGGTRHESKLRAVLEHYTDVPVLGAIHENATLALTERHLGLIPANETQAAQQQVSDIADRIAAQVDLDALLNATQSNRVLSAPPPLPVSTPFMRVAIAQDAAFGFYYADDLDAFKTAGAELIPFNTLHDAHLPACDALFIGGGFPECFLDDLEANTSLRTHIHEAIEAGLPTYAECGGLMYLSRSITWKGQTRQMVGSINADVVMHEKPVGRGYAVLNPSPEHPWGSPETTDIKAHEFHYSSLDHLPPDTRFAYTVSRGYGIDGQHDGILHKNLLASYIHLRTSSNYHWPAQFLQFARHKGVSSCLQ